MNNLQETLTNVVSRVKAEVNRCRFAFDWIASLNFFLDNAEVRDDYLRGMRTGSIG